MADPLKTVRVADPRQFRGLRGIILWLRLRTARSLIGRHTFVVNAELRAPFGFWLAKRDPSTYAWVSDNFFHQSAHQIPGTMLLEIGRARADDADDVDVDVDPG